MKKEPIRTVTSDVAYKVLNEYFERQDKKQLANVASTLTLDLSQFKVFDRLPKETQENLIYRTNVYLAGITRLIEGERKDMVLKVGSFDLIEEA
jgi:hypothetical protein